ncbi:cell wall hydrolase [Novosphingobium album (ex Liu et al. 2023)]|nr:cell wall hydrolase [Novosphingobium album (ex Liu et al. 2023)]
MAFRLRALRIGMPRFPFWKKSEPESEPVPEHRSPLRLETSPPPLRESLPLALDDPAENAVFLQGGKPLSELEQDTDRSKTLAPAMPMPGGAIAAATSAQAHHLPMAHQSRVVEPPPPSILKFIQPHIDAGRAELRFFKALSFVLIVPLIAGVTYFLGFGSSRSVPDALAEDAGSLSPDQAPTPEPLVFEDKSPQEARAINDETPFVGALGAPAKPFMVAGPQLSRSRAIDCLATAMWYEAGNSEQGQLSVGQVILNRVRHPAFPKTVCGVVFQGSKRKTGCQFTFTCDGSLDRRRPSTAAMSLAANRAVALLYGYTYNPVGLATHYHTDWVHPVWSEQMDKLAKVETHLFFRWHGPWGRPQAMRGKYEPSEPNIARLAYLSDFQPGEEQSLPQLAANGLPPDNAAPGGAGAATGEAPAMGRDSFFRSAVQEEPSGPLDVELASSGGDGTAQAMGVIGKCGDRSFCKLYGRVNGDKRQIAFLYVRDRRERIERVYWDCGVFHRSDPKDCLTAETRIWMKYETAG